MARQAVLTSLTDPDEIAYRQDILRDCLDHPAAVRELYAVAAEAVTGKRKVYYGILSKSPSSILYRSVQILEHLVGYLRRLREIADRDAGGFRSEGSPHLSQRSSGSSTTSTSPPSTSTCGGCSSATAC